MVKNWQAVFSLIKTVLLRRGHSEQDADDLVQEAWVRLAQYARQQAVLEPEAFLMQTALNLSRDAYRATRNHGEQVQYDETVLVDGAPNVEAVILSRERMTRMQECVVRLNSKTRDIFLSHRIHGMSYQQIARQHRLSVSSVEKHMAKATLLITGWMEGWYP